MTEPYLLPRILQNRKRVTDQEENVEDINRFAAEGNGLEALIRELMQFLEDLASKGPSAAMDAAIVRGPLERRSFKQIGQEVGISEEAVKKRYQRVLPKDPEALSRARHGPRGRLRDRPHPPPVGAETWKTRATARYRPSISASRRR